MSKDDMDGDMMDGDMMGDDDMEMGDAMGDDKQERPKRDAHGEMTGDSDGKMMMKKEKLKKLFGCIVGAEKKRRGMGKKKEHGMGKGEKDGYGKDGYGKGDG